MKVPRSFVTLNFGPSNARAAVAPIAATIFGFTTAISASSHGWHARTSSAFGFLWMRRLPCGVNLKCLTALVT